MSGAMLARDYLEIRPNLYAHRDCLDDPYTTPTVRWVEDSRIAIRRAAGALLTFREAWRYMLACFRGWRYERMFRRVGKFGRKVAV